MYISVVCTHLHVKKAPYDSVSLKIHRFSDHFPERIVVVSHIYRSVNLITTEPCSPEPWKS